MARLAAVLTVPQFAKLAGVSRRRMHRILDAANVPPRRLGLMRLVFLTDLKFALPDLWESICEFQRLGQ